MNASRFAGLTPLKIALAYAVAGAVWIAFSDRALVALFSDGPLFDAVMTGKGWLFVAVSGVVLYAMISYRERALRETRTELEQSRTQLSILHRVLRHNLRNHCTVVRSCSDLIERERADEETLARIRRTTDDLVALSEKSQHLKSLLEADDTTHRIDLSERTRDLVPELDASYPDATIETELADAAVASVVDQYDVVLGELVGNAVEHHDAPDPTIRISVATDDAGDVSLVVADDGPGIPSMERRVLEDGIEEPMFHSQGLGLWLVRVFVQQSGGDLRVEDNDPRGTAIRITLPAASD
ncbi:sensor histidine kinase [Halorientalis sp. IM1011]|uniref:sensor histidine kinase n=1 Tax=Halorientalis sp. IM1011 TaxID=1932360 RepID=UPI000A05EBEE|nr:HAMP domain-containing sensor histidine kinase [Halorientalis sp. IM1011]